MVSLRLPRLQPIRYPALEGSDVVYGLRLSIPNYARKGASGWVAEVGKIGDDSLKTHLLGSYVGCADNFYYFRVESAEETHAFLACLFLADMITREEAESVLSKARSPSSSSSSATLRATIIHRLPSLATLGGAFWAGQSLTTEILATSSILTGASTTMLATAPSAAGALALFGATLLFSRSARAREGGTEVEEAEGGTEMVLWEGARRRVNTALIHTLDERELSRNPVFSRLREGYLDAEMARRRITSMPDEASGSKGVA